MTEVVDSALAGYQLSDRYTKDSGRVFMSGVQAAARLPLEQLRADHLAGLSTAAFVSGYPGSPLAGFDSSDRRRRPVSGAPQYRPPASGERRIGGDRSDG